MNTRTIISRRVKAQLLPSLTLLVSTHPFNEQGLLDDAHDGEVDAERGPQVARRRLEGVVNS